MPRPARIDVADGFYHVIARGVGRTDIFRSDRDRFDFLDRLAQLVPKQNIALMAYVLMNNHVHLVLRRGRLPLAQFMARLLTGHAAVFNLRYDRVGHLFQNRYRAILCDSDSYFLELVRYVHLNPVRAKLVGSPAAYSWSSHRAYLRQSAPDWLSVDLMLTMVGGVGGYRSYIAAGVKEGSRPDLCGVSDGATNKADRRLWCRGQVLGDSSFASKYDPAAVSIQKRSASAVPGQLDILALARQITAHLDVSLDELLSGSKRHKVSAARHRLVREAIESHGARPIELSRYLGVSTAAISSTLHRRR